VLIIWYGLVPVHFICHWADVMKAAELGFDFGFILFFYFIFVTSVGLVVS